ncbi:hypothetical protein ACFFQF_05375 [Haladaptatus pallidirubidus]|uniref:hypothetical protein n=1 Tax=Haladaptatus pallidirubidus TaxID=1008152 RepID=UPI0035EDB9AC
MVAAIEDGHVVIVAEQIVHEVTTDESGATDDECAVHAGVISGGGAKRYRRRRCELIIVGSSVKKLRWPVECLSPVPQ